MLNKFKNPHNDYVETATTPLGILACFLFGPLYFLFKGNIKHFALSILLAICTVGMSFFIYPFFVYAINAKHYLRKGWIPA